MSQPVVPEQVSVALAELAGEMREGLLALAVDGSGELPVAGYELFSDTEVLGRMALDRMLGGMSDQRASRRRRSSLGHRCPERQRQRIAQGSIPILHQPYVAIYMRQISTSRTDATEGFAESSLRNAGTLIFGNPFVNRALRCTPPDGPMALR